MNNPYYIVTHKEIPWTLPFNHFLIGVDGYAPDSKLGLATAEVLSKNLDSETTFGTLRSLMPINQDLNNYNNDVTVFWGSYRLMLSKEFNEDWLSTSMADNRIVSPEELDKKWMDIVATEMPNGVDIIVAAPKQMPHSLMGQYMGNHHLDDLMFGVGCAIRFGLLDPTSVPQMLASTTLIPYGNFAAKKSIRFDFNQKVWDCALYFYKHYYRPRTGYQRRVIDFVFERIISMAIVQMIVRLELKCVSSRSLLISNNGQYSISK